MNKSRSIISGIIIWVLIFISFTVMSFIPVLKDSEIQQNLILFFLLVPIVILGVSYYYKSGQKVNGLIVGFIVIVISLILDAIITVPFVIIPHGGNYLAFFFSPFLWIMGLEILIISSSYWKIKIYPQE